VNTPYRSAADFAYDAMCEEAFPNRQNLGFDDRRTPKSYRLEEELRPNISTFPVLRLFIIHPCGLHT
jgi:hypothetical protein